MLHIPVCCGWPAAADTTVRASSIASAAVYSTSSRGDISGEGRNVCHPRAYDNAVKDPCCPEAADADYGTVAIISRPPKMSFSTRFFDTKKYI